MNPVPPDRCPPLLTRRLLVFTGKGGVGKSTLSAATALLAARRGKRVLVCEVNAGDRIPALLGVPPVGPSIGSLGENLWGVDVRPHEAMIEYGLMKLRYAALVNAVLENRLMRYFLKALPSLSEVVMLGKILFHVRELEGGRPRFDLVVLDAPATGHGLSLLRIPQVVMATVPPGPLQDDMRWMGELLADPAQTAINLVSLPEDMPVNETLELDRALRDVARLPRGVCFLNGVWPDRLRPEELAGLPGGATWRPMKATLESMQARADLGAEQARRLREGTSLKVVELPYLFAERFGRAEAQRLAGLLGEKLEEGGLADRRAEAEGPKHSKEETP